MGIFSFLGDNTSFFYKSAGSDGGGDASIYSSAGEEGVGFTGVYAQMVLNFILDQISSTGGIDLKGFHFVQESITPTIYRHTLNSFIKGKPQILHYDSDRKARDERSKINIKNSKLPSKYPAFQRDEYPFASTFEGANADVMYVPSRENSIQGGNLRVLYKMMNTGDAFIVIPVPRGRDLQEEKQRVLDGLVPAPTPIITGPDFSRPAVPYKMWPLVMGAAVITGIILYSRFVPVIP